MSGSQDARSLFASYAFGEIAAEQLQVLEGALREDSELRREFIEYLNVDSALSDLAVLTPTELAEIERDVTNNASRRKVSPVAPTASPGWQFRSAMAAVAVAATLLLIAIVCFNWSDSPAHEPIATLVTDVDALLLRDRQPCSDSRLPTGEYQLQRGLLHLQFANNVMVYVEAPAHFDIVGAACVLLHSGRLSANVPPEGVGFTVETPEAEVVDFGTEFSVDVAGGASEVHVFDGLVRVNPGASHQRETSKSIDLQASEAIRITRGTSDPVDISIESNRFIRNFDEPRLNYARAIKQLSPVAYYRMPIRDRGLVSEPPEYSGVVLTGEGRRPPHAKGVFAGGSLRVGVDSIGRGGRVDSPPALSTGQFSIAVFVYLESPAPSGVIATNMDGKRGNFDLSINEHGMLHATGVVDEVTSPLRKTGVVDEVTSPEPRTIPSKTGLVTSSTTGGSVLPQKTWRHVVVTADGVQLQLYEDGKLVASTPCAAMATSESDPIWFGTNASTTQVWDGRIDEVTLFDRALSEEEIAALYRTAQEEITRMQ